LNQRGDKEEVIDHVRVKCTKIDIQFYEHNCIYGKTENSQNMVLHRRRFLKHGMTQDGNQRPTPDDEGSGSTYTGKSDPANALRVKFT
jgi:hypothetical protein